MKVVYICSPYRASTPEQVQKHIEYAKKLSLQYVLAGYAVITPHLYYTNFLNDDDEKERELGLKSARELIKGCDFMVVGNHYGISDGMQAEAEEAIRLGIDITYEKDNKVIKVED